MFKKIQHQKKGEKKMHKIIGLTGKTGAGKSTVSEKLREYGAFVIDGDVVSRKVLCDDPGLLSALQNAFGADVVVAGALDRRLLAARAFSTKNNTDILNSILHPAINCAIIKEVKEAFLQYDVVIVDAAAIIESGFYEKCDSMIVVTAPENIRKERIINRDELSEKDAIIRIRGQRSDKFYTDKADYIVRNYEPFNLETELKPVLKELFNAD